MLYQKKKLVMSTLLGVEMRSLGRQLAELAAQDRYARELSRSQLFDTLVEVTASLSVYRTYIRNMELPEHAVHYIGQALDNARSRTPHLPAACFDFVREVLLLQNLPHVLPDQREARLAFVMVEKIIRLPDGLALEKLQVTVASEPESSAEDFGRVSLYEDVALEGEPGW